MNLDTILKADAVKALGAISSKKRLFQDIGDVAEASCGVDAAKAVAALRQREALGPTGVGKGIALPHARLDGIDQVHGVFLKLEKPLDFDAVDRQPVDIVFALFAPEEAGVDHLKALALVSRTLRDAQLCGKLRANTDPTTLHALMTDWQSTQAA